MWIEFLHIVSLLCQGKAFASFCVSILKICFQIAMVCIQSAVGLVAGISEEPFLSVCARSSHSVCLLNIRHGPALKTDWACFSPRAVMQWNLTGQKTGTEKAVRSCLTVVQRTPKPQWCEIILNRNRQEIWHYKHRKKTGEITPMV